jgi:hypothetical protein
MRGLILINVPVPIALAFPACFFFMTLDINFMHVRPEETATLDIFSLLAAPVYLSRQPDEKGGVRTHLDFAAPGRPIRGGLAM